MGTRQYAWLRVGIALGALALALGVSWYVVAHSATGSSTAAPALAPPQALQAPANAVARPATATVLAPAPGTRPGRHAQGAPLSATALGPPTPTATAAVPGAPPSPVPTLWPPRDPPTPIPTITPTPPPSPTPTATETPSVTPTQPTATPTATQPTATPTATWPTAPPRPPAPVAARPVGRVDRPGSPGSPGIPVRLRIPYLGINTAVEAVGMKDGNMDVPSGWWTVGWFRLGIHPGEQGNAVIDGHLDSTTGSAIFMWVRNLRPGHLIYVTDDLGVERAFVVTEVSSYANADVPLQRLFGSSSERHLNLITCSGAWQAQQHLYDQRLVVYSRLVGS